jgi:hypothetical protein
MKILALILMFPFISLIMMVILAILWRIKDESTKEEKDRSPLILGFIITLFLYGLYFFLIG